MPFNKISRTTLIKPAGNFNKITARILDSSIGTCDYSVDFISDGWNTQYLHTAQAVNGIILQWATAALPLDTMITDAIAKIAELHPEPKIEEEEPTDA